MCSPPHSTARMARASILQLKSRLANGAKSRRRESNRQRDQHIASQRRTGSIPGIAMPLVYSSISCAPWRTMPSKVLALLLGIRPDGFGERARLQPAPAPNAYHAVDSASGSGDIWHEAYPGYVPPTGRPSPEAEGDVAKRFPIGSDSPSCC